MPDGGHGGGLRKAVVPGSFDPVTNGHLDIIARAAQLYDEVTVAVLINRSKNSAFTTNERAEMLRETTASYGNVRVESFYGLLVDFCKDRGIGVIVKSLRSVSDFEYELQMAQMNKGQGDVDTVFLVTNPLYSFLSSSLVKEFATYGGDVSGLVPATVLRRLTDRFGRTDELPGTASDHT
jgi:pantetheine-phosphate adenylyltransferase